MLGERKKIKRYQMIERNISLSIIIALTFINFLIVGNAMISYATDLSLDMQKQETSNENVTLIHIDAMPWPLITLLRFRYFLSILLAPHNQR